MVTSIVLQDRHKIGIDSNGRFLIGESKIKVEEVPFVRYRFDDFKESDKEYISKMMETFKYSAHLAEVTIKDGFEEQVAFLNDNLESLIVFLYLPINDQHVESCELTEHDVELLNKIDSSMIYERIMLKDCSETLYLVSANKLKQKITEITGFNMKHIGICSSPLSFGENACLTAVRARELASMYVENEKCAIPSANHECMNCCGCIRYLVVDRDLAAPVSKKSGGRKSTTSKPKEVKTDTDSKTSEEDAKPKKKISKKAMSAW